MKRLFSLFILLFTVCLFNSALAQQLKTITLDKKDPNFAKPRLIEVSAGDSVRFQSIDGDFSILILNAESFLENVKGDLSIRVNSATTPQSEIYKVKERVRDEVKTYQIYCITNTSWPDAPPRIIIVSQ